MHFIAMIAVHGFSTANSSVEEGRRLDISFQMNVKGLTQFGSALVVSGTVSAAASGTASKFYCSIATPYGYLPLLQVLLTLNKSFQYK